jgi:hypothetical protein
LGAEIWGDITRDIFILAFQSLGAEIWGDITRDIFILAVKGLGAKSITRDI